MDRTLLQSIENVYRLKEDGLDLIEFTRFFMNCLEHTEREAPFLAAGLAQLFEAVARGKSKICFSGLTDYICEVKMSAFSKYSKTVAKRTWRGDGFQWRATVNAPKV